MKKLVIFVALTVATLALKAQAPADSVSVMFRHLANTNTEIFRLNRAYTTHAVMVSGGAAVMTMGFLYARRTEEIPGFAEPQLKANRIRTGLGIAAAGALVIAASVVTMPRRVHIDERGLVVDLP